MKYNKSRVYTALNADELEVGSRVIVADDILTLEVKVKDGTDIRTLTGIGNTGECSRFKVKCDNAGETYWFLAYLVEEPESLKWTDLKIGDIIRSKNGRKIRMVTGIDIDNTQLHVVTDMYISDDDLKYWEKVDG